MAADRLPDPEAEIAQLTEALERLEPVQKHHKDKPITFQPQRSPPARGSHD